MYYKGEKVELHAGLMRNNDFHGYGPSIRNRLTELIPRDVDIRVLDVGTGFGLTSKFLVRHLSKSSRVCSLDPSAEVLTRAKAAISPKDKGRIAFVLGSADDMEFEDRSFDIVVSVMVMHHIEDAGESIAEMARVLKSGGRLIVVDFSPGAHVLDFAVRHAKEDFFTSASISKAARASRLRPRVENHGKWYLVEAAKPGKTE